MTSILYYANIGYNMMRFATKIQIIFEIGIDELSEELAKEDVEKLVNKIKESFKKEYGTTKVKVSGRIKKLPF